MAIEGFKDKGGIQSYIRLCAAGDLETVSAKLETKHLEERKSIVNTIVNGSTCLISSCRRGHLELVSYLINECGAELELTGSVDFDGEVVEGASPLWCACAAGQLGIAELLLNHGAGVNRATHTSSTPLRAACFDGHFDVVQLLVGKGADIEIANRHGHTCLMISCYKGHASIVRFLLDRGARLDRSSAKGNTAMHDAAESGNLSILRLLMAYGAVMQRDVHGLTPLMGAANCGHANVVDFLAGDPTLVPDAEERAMAMELLACTLVDRKREWAGAVRRWKRSLMMREKLGIPKTVEKPQKAFNGASEFRTIEELQQMAADPEALRYQALIVRLRVLGPAHPDTTYYLRYRGAVYADQRQYDVCEKLWLYALELQQAHSRPHCPASLACFNNFIELFTQMLRDKTGQDFSSIEYVLGRCLQELRRSLSSLTPSPSCASSPLHSPSPSPPPSPTPPCSDRPLQFADRLLKRATSLVGLLCEAGRPPSADMCAQLHAAARLQSPLTGNSLLHVACGSSPLAVARLLALGADVDACNNEGESPLHACARAGDSCTAMTLLAAGAHADAANCCGRTPAQLLVELGRADSPDGRRMLLLLQSVRSCTLACRCALVLASMPQAVVRAQVAEAGALHLLPDIRRHRGNREACMHTL